MTAEWYFFPHSAFICGFLKAFAFLFAPSRLRVFAPIICRCFSPTRLTSVHQASADKIAD